MGEQAAHGRWLLAGWVLALGVAAGVRLWNALAGPLMWGYDAWGHVAYVLFLDLYRAVPWADQGWSYFHPPLHYVLGWGLAQAGSGEVLMRGLSLLGSAASLATAGLAAWLARITTPAHPGLALLAFVVVALLPVQLFMSPMPGNELTACLLTAATLSAFVWNERRPRAAPGGAVLVGALAGLGLLTKFSGLLVLLVVLSALFVRPFLRGDWRDSPGRVAVRGALIALFALSIPAPYYARNVLAFGVPFQLSRDFPLVTSVEQGQPPGARDLGHYLRFPLETFSNPNPLAAHLVDAVWASVYLNVWADTYRESDTERALEADRQRRRSTQRMALLGLLPTGAALAGGLLALGDVWRGRRRAVYVVMLVQAAASLSAFAIFAWRVPIWSALKASYLFGLSLPCALFVARSAEALLARPVAWQRWLLPSALTGVFAAAAAVGTSGVVLPMRADAPASGAVRFYFGEYEEARTVYGRLIEGARHPVPWLDNLAAIELAEGRTSQARRLYERAVDLESQVGRVDPYRSGRLAVAAALDGNHHAALAILGTTLSRSSRPELLANRGAIRASAGDRGGAVEDLRAALEGEPAQVAAWLNLARVLDELGRPDEAAEARTRAREEACRPPRGFPYGVGSGEVLEWGVARRSHLLLEDGGLGLAPPAFYRRSCG